MNITGKMINSVDNSILDSISANLKLIIVFVVFCLSFSCFSAAPTVTSNTKALAHFDNSSIISLDYGANTNITTYGSPQIIDDGKHGKCLRLNIGDYISFSGLDNIGSYNEGTIMFWVRPHWDNNQSISHTFCSMRLDNGGYMAMSDGWRETTVGLNKFYFYANSIHYLCSVTTDVAVPLTANKWYHVAMTFRFDGENNSFTRMYINGKLVGSDNTVLGSPGTVAPSSISGEFKIGSSAGIEGNSMFALRYADADFDEFVILNNALSDSDINSEYMNQNKKEIIAHFDRWPLALDEASSDKTITIVGNPTVINDGVIGKCLSLNNGDYITIEAENNLGEFNEGTVMFWVRPHWNNNQGVAHTFIGMLLNNEGPNGYMAITDGLYSQLNTFYFIPNNQFYLHQTLPDSSIPLTAGQWYHVAMTFRFNGDDDSYAKMYINGELVASDNTPQVNTPGIVSPRGVLQLGSSLGIISGDPRYADADFSDLSFSTTVLSSTIIKNSYLLGYKYSTFFYRDILRLADKPYKPQIVDNKIKETRFLFDELGSYDSKVAAETLVNKAKAAGFNAIVVCVYHGRGARWNTTTLPAESTAYQTLIEGKEPLQYLIDYAHSQGIDIHAWFTVNACYGVTMIDYFKNKGWVDDSFRINESNYNIIVHYVGFRTWMSRLILEVLQKYNIDGINLDYIRAKGFCTTQYCQDDYNAKYGRNLLDDIAAEEYSYLGSWNYNAVTNIVRQVNTKVKAENPNIPISICGNLWDDDHTSSHFAEQGRDGLSWAKLGLIDFVLFMDYSNRPDYEHFEASVQTLTDGSFGKAGFIISNYVSVPELGSRDADYTAKLLSMAQRMNTGIVACYWYGRLTDEMISVFKDGPFKDEAVPHYK